MKSNAIAWNPIEAFNFTVANEDHSCYTFDMRKMRSALNVLTDHVPAVLDLAYSPTGEEFVTGSLFCVKFSMDAKFVLSGSDDGNIRLWKGKVNEKLGAKEFRERNHFEYTEKLKERYKDLPEVKRIARHRHVPKAIYSASKLKRTMLQARAVKEENRRKHSKPGSVPHVAERKKHVLGLEK
ncbi:MAG: Sof1-like domain-containing protein [Olpidium bornovanus]|uniref:Sof1-like domain-containing protein n=1 Tax=Olpidium bornovanus TaxID=278681 RepID=A0A8H7ZWD1_9FUNG|nr:MAG: Sof1-like domain-containing protein [Olpidium bornovanus]